MHGREETVQGREETVQGRELTVHGREETVQGREEAVHGREETVHHWTRMKDLMRLGINLHVLESNFSLFFMGNFDGSNYSLTHVR